MARFARRPPGGRARIEIDGFEIGLVVLVAPVPRFHSFEEMLIIGWRRFILDGDTTSTLDAPSNGCSCISWASIIYCVDYISGRNNIWRLPPLFFLRRMAICGNNSNKDF